MDRLVARTTSPQPNGLPEHAARLTDGTLLNLDGPLGRRIFEARIRGALARIATATRAGREWASYDR